MRISVNVAEPEVTRGRRAWAAEKGQLGAGGYEEARTAANSVVPGTDSRLWELSQSGKEHEDKKTALNVETAETEKTGEGQRSEAARIYEAVTAGKDPLKELRQPPKVPYGHLAEDGTITYNGVVFVCEERTNSIRLGDMTNEKNVLTIGLSGGGSLKVNRNSLGMLSKAIGMFSPEDVNRIMRAIAQDTKIQSMKKEIDDLEANVGNEITEGTETAEGDQQTKDRDLEEVS